MSPMIEDGRPQLAILEAHLRERPTCPLPLYVRDWLLKGIAHHRREGADLAKALGLRLVGRDSTATRDRRDRRDHALRAAGALLNNDPSALAAAVRRFEAATWPRWRALPFPPTESSELHHRLFAAFQDGPVPTSAKQLGRILHQTPNQPY
jgi:hypothetical protein